MEAFFGTHSDASAGFVGESLVDAAQGIGGGSESSMSASAAPPLGLRKVAATKTKQTNFSASEDNVLWKSWLEISCDAATNTGQRKEAFWKMLKDEPKWSELKRKMDTPQNSGSKENVLTNEQRNILDIDLNESSAATSTGKRPMGRDAAKAAKKKVAAASGSHEYVSKMQDISVEKIELFKETEVKRKTRLDEIVTLEKVKVEEARKHRLLMLELERERLAMEKQRLQMEAEKKENEDEEKEKKEDERILAINLDQCQPLKRIYYQALQEEIINNMRSRRRQGPSQRHGDE